MSQIQEVVGFTINQRKWFLDMFNNRCQFRSFNGLIWVQCPNKAILQLHHIIPRGWAKMHMPVNFQLNGSMNGIILCAEHHVGQYGVHTDTFLSKMRYNAGLKTAFEKMMEERLKLNQKGIPYWNTRWDMMFSRITRKAVLRYIRAHPYPANGNRGNTGRIQPPT